MTGAGGIAVTTSMRAGDREAAHAQHLASLLGATYSERLGRSLPEVAAGAAADGAIEAIVVVEAGRTSLVSLAPDGAETGRLFFHPGMALMRIRRLASGGRDPMVDAMGLVPGDTVLDCTLGLASDAVVSSWVVGPSGHVLGIEASPVLAVLVREGLMDYSDAEEDVLAAMGRIEAECGLHEHYLSESGGGSFDVVYFDPMFRSPVTASPGIAPLRAWAHAGNLSPQALNEAVRVARRRVVVKDRHYGGELARLGITERSGGRKSSVEYGIIHVDAVGGHR
ncbi:MAG: class I SAM-dependent methyltransferase [Clostridia bacterium]|nr:class I SAM-dependent methyltransferase [Clostridia bacterium]